ncbi:MAG: glycerol kinase GlpK [Dehalococcoidales bacterium]|nr:MAG: glycerol kinase GlpK [Dehalococcoidales bacterium]
MSDKDFIMAIDQGTTGTTALLFNKEGLEVARAYREIRQIYPQPGWVEHDPGEIFRSCISVAGEAVQKAGVPFSMVKALGITNQRETTVVWERVSGQPVYNAVVWQCRRTAGLCDGLKQKNMEPSVREKTGLPIDAYFSATKIRWILDNVSDGQRRAEQGELLFGTVDSWLAWNLTGGKTHITDYSNASRTMLFNINILQWDQHLLGSLDIPEAMLPQVLPSSQTYGETSDGLFGDSHIPVAGIAGDQQAALFGQACYHAGMAKNTYGTGSFILVNTGNYPVFSNKGLVTTLAWGLDNRVVYAMEGSIFITGAAVQWLRDGLGLIATAAESEALAATVPDNGGVYFVPAFVGLGTPYWDMYARGTIVGLTRDSTGGHLARATLEAIAFQTRDVVDAISAEADLPIPVLRVDGGGSVNSLLMQFQADILGIPIQRAHIVETTALGVAYLAGLAVGMWRDTAEVEQYWKSTAVYEPRMSPDERETLYSNWRHAVERARGWIKS